MTDVGQLRAAAEAALQDLDGVTATTGSGGDVAWARGGVEFAVLDGARIELRIGAPIAAAAVRTPDTTISSRGRDWIAFRPRILDVHAVDRLGAWIGAAHRRAE